MNATNTGPIFFLEDLRRERENAARTVQLIDLVLAQKGQISALQEELDNLKSVQGNKQ